MKKVISITFAFGVLIAGGSIAQEKDYLSWEQLTPQQAYFARHF